MFYLGIALFAWLAIGFLAGVKMVFVDQILERDLVREAQKELDQMDADVAEFFLGNKKAFIAFHDFVGGCSGCCPAQRKHKVVDEELVSK